MVNPLDGPTSDDKLWAGLSYAGAACCAIPSVAIYMMKKDESDFLKFHGLQSIAFGLFCIVYAIVIMVLNMILGFIPGIGLLFSLGTFVLGLGLTGYWIYLMVMAFTGKDIQIPVLSGFLHENLMR